jgi:GTP-binding protein YchF
VTYADIAGLEGRGKGSISGALMNELSHMDGFLHVVRCFEDESVPHISGSIDPARDVQTMDTELLLNDLIAVERKLERLEDERGKGGRDKAEIDREEVLFQRLQIPLTQENPLRTMDHSPEELRHIAGFQFLTLKPILVVLNLSEGQVAPDLSGVMPYSKAVALQGQLEMEIAQLPPDEVEVFLEEYGIEEPSLNRMIRESYELLGLLSFFTVEGDEVRAWAVRRGATAPEAAGVVHTDMQRGFIRAEVVPFDVLDELGNMAAVRDHGKLRVEGKDYVVQDGDVIKVRFNV